MPQYLSVCPTKQVFLYGFFVSTNRVLPVLRNYIQHRLNGHGAVYQVDAGVGGVTVYLAPGAIQNKVVIV